MHRTFAWFKARLTKPYFVHRGVPVFHVLHPDGDPLHFQFSWLQTRNQGDRIQPGECFDVRQLPGYEERPPTGDFFVWSCLRDRDIRRQITELIDLCLEDGDGPWMLVQRRLFDVQGLLSAVLQDARVRPALRPAPERGVRPQPAERRPAAPSVARH
ncbi:MAG TPA: hypothetical protein VGD81_11195 [Opitutaceae bacterium]